MARKLVVEIIGDASSLERSFGSARRATNQFERESGKAFRGVASGSGAFRSLGRSIAFASGAFIGFSSAAAVIRQSVDAATEAAATQRQLEAQFKASGLSLRDYEAQIDKTTNRLSRLAGFNNDELRQSFLTAFRATRSVSVGLKIEQAAAEASRGTGKSLAATTAALSKAVEGSSGSLKRLNIILPANIKGVKILDAVMARFKGQAIAGTTAQERLNAAIHNTKEAVGAALLPAVNKLANSISMWLSKSQNQARLQRDVTLAVQDTTQAVALLAAAFKIAARFAEIYREAVKKIPKFPHFPGVDSKQVSEILKVLFVPGFGLKAAADALSGGTRAPVKPPPGLSGPVGTPGGGLAPGLTGPLAGGGAVGGTGAGVGLATRLAQIALALAKAGLTQSAADDRRLLVAEAAIVKALIARAKRLHLDLKTRTALYQQLAGIDDQITAIDQAQAAKAQAAKDKQREARQKQLDHLKSLRQDYTAATTAFTDALKGALDDARSTIGQLFAGPVLQPSADALKARLGVRIAGTRVGSLTSDLNAQVAQATQFFKDLARLRKRGASSQLVDELRQGGDIAQAHALAGASPAALRAFLKAFQARERLASRVAIQTPAVRIAAQHVTVAGSRLNADGGHVNVNVYVDGHKVPATVKTTQRRGRHAGTRG